MAAQITRKASDFTTTNRFDGGTIYIFVENTPIASVVPAWRENRDGEAVMRLNLVLKSFRDDQLITIDPAKLTDVALKTTAGLREAIYAAPEASECANGSRAN